MVLTPLSFNPEINCTLNGLRHDIFWMRFSSLSFLYSLLAGSIWRFAVALWVHYCHLQSNQL